MDKNTLLRKLQKRIENKFGKNKIWLFPRGDNEAVANYFETDLGKKVKGFWGTGEKPNSDDIVMIIAERPSMGRGKSHKKFDKWVARFYEILEKNGLDNSHLTDFIKTRARVGYDWEDFSQHLPILKQELAIIKPNKIIVLGKKINLWVAICKFFWNLKNVKLVCAPHYANRFKKTEELEKEFLASVYSN